MDYWVLGIIGVIVLLIIGVIVWIAKTYNLFIALRNKVKDQWSQIDVQLKRRFDLIPNLVETVKGYAAHEKSALEAVIAARNQFAAATTPEGEMEASNQITGALSRLFALSEAYPELKANANFTELQGQLKDTEDKISFSRQFYNDTVLKYQNAIEMFPRNIIAGMFKFEPAAFFEAGDGERENVRVQF